MKKTITYLSVSILLIALLQSCTKEQLGLHQTLTISLEQNQVYEFDFGHVATGEITRQAGHFETSKMQISIPDLKAIYTYVPAKDYTGTDEVELTVSKGKPQTNQNACGFGGSPGCSQQSGFGGCGQDDEIVYTVHFNIEGDTE